MVDNDGVCPDDDEGWEVEVGKDGVKLGLLKVEEDGEVEGRIDVEESFKSVDNGRLLVFLADDDKVLGFVDFLIVVFDRGTDLVGEEGLGGTLER